jgi:hypothetical protein
MALRILHSLIPTLINDLQSEQQVKDTHSFLAFDLIPGAKEVFEYGAKAVAWEFEISSNEELKQKIKQAIYSGHYVDGLKLAVTGFLQKFRAATGNQAWSKFAQALIELKSKIDRVEQTQSPADAMMLTAYLNAIDGMAHNTGTFMEKLVQQEGGYMTHDKVDELARMRDITRLPTDEAIALMRDYLPNAPKEYRDAYKEYTRLHPGEDGEYQAAIMLLKDFQRKRQLEELTINNPSDNIQPVTKKQYPAPPKKAA